MPKKAPSYRLHKATGQGYTEHQRKSYYFGPYGSPESLAKYGRFVAELGALRRAASVVLEPGSNVLVAELIDAFLDYAERRYVKHGKPTTELGSYRVSLDPVSTMYGDQQSSDFGPVSLEVVRDGWVKAGLARKTINRYVARVVRCWKWGVSKQVVPVTAWQALCSLESLRAGQGIDYPPVVPAADSRVNAIKPHVSRQVWAMIQFQLWTACRPLEACQVRMADIDTSQDVWVYRPGRFKTQHHAGSERIVYIGPHARQIVQEWIKDNPEELLWQPRDARREWLTAHGSTKRGLGKHQAGYQYTSATYARAVERGCEKAFKCPAKLKRLYVPKEGDDVAQIKADAAVWRETHCWSPNQLRHTAATRIRDAYGIEVARIILGHTNAFTTELYAETEREKAMAAVRASG